MNNKIILKHRNFLLQEIEELQTRVKPQDTGHIRSAISVLRTRVKELDRQLNNDPEWKDEYLLGV